jgi:hypothetical protein
VGRRQLLSSQERRLRRMLLDFHGTRRSLLDVIGLLDLGEALGGEAIVPTSSPEAVVITGSNGAKVGRIDLESPLHPSSS